MIAPRPFTRFQQAQVRKMAQVRLRRAINHYGTTRQVLTNEAVFLQGLADSMDEVCLVYDREAEQRESRKGRKFAKVRLTPRVKQEEARA